MDPENMSRLVRIGRGFVMFFVIAGVLMLMRPVRNAVAYTVSFGAIPNWDDWVNWNRPLIPGVGYAPNTLQNNP